MPAPRSPAPAIYAQRQQHLDPGREQQPGGGGGQPGEHMLHVGIVLEAGVDHAQPTTIAVGALMRPSKAHSAPRSPRNSIPTATDRLITLPPGRNWHSPSSSVNCSPLSQRRRSTSMLRASGSTPPKPISPNHRKPTNSAALPALPPVRF